MNMGANEIKQANSVTLQKDSTFLSLENNFFIQMEFLTIVFTNYYSKCIQLSTYVT